MNCFSIMAILLTLKMITMCVHSNPSELAYERGCLPWVYSELELTNSTCQRWDGLPRSYLPNVSIIITYHNENSKILDDTLSSIWTHTPDQLIKEVILIDDNSRRGGIYRKWLKEPKIRIIRNPTRAGLIRSRMIGARAATAPILIFLDAHVETNPHWLEPMLARLVHVRKLTENCADSSKQPECQDIAPGGLIVAPQIYDISNPEPTLHQKIVGGFSWNLTFKWEYAEDSVDKTISTCQPWSTPAISGGIFAAWHQHFLDQGGYDEEMEIWGAENIELSLRMWQCHGRLEIVPCSKIGHLYRETHPYVFPEGKEYTVIRNRKRAIMVWMTHTNEPQPICAPKSKQYLSYFFQQSPTAWKIPAGNVSSRRQLAKQLGCNEFEWYLENVYPELERQSIYLTISRAAEQTAERELKLLDSV